ASRLPSIAETPFKHDASLTAEAGGSVIGVISRVRPGVKTALLFLTAWFVAAVAASAGGLFENIPSSVLLVSGFFIPLTVFLAAHIYSARFRSFVLAQNPRQLTLLQASRITGFIFIVEYLKGNLPPAFAIPTALSDVTIGSAALIAASRLVSADGVPKPAFALWHRFGVFGLLVSGGMGILTSPTPLGILASDI